MMVRPAISHALPSRRQLRSAPAARPAPNGKPTWLLTILVWVLLVFMTVPEGFDYEANTSMPTEGSAISRIVWLLLLGVGAACVLRRPGKAWALLRQVNPWLLLFGCLATASVAWSIDPAVTVRRLVRLLTFGVDAMALMLVSWRPIRFQETVRPGLTLILIGSIAFVLWNPRLAVEQLAQAELVGAWHGLATQKNGLASIAGIGVVFWMHAWLSRESKALWVIVGLGASLTCLIMSRGSTALIASVFASLLLVMLLRSPPGLRRYMPYLVASFAVLLILYSLAVLNLVPGLGLLLKPIAMLTGKDQTFTGRTAIWAVVTEHIHLRPLLGSGYGAYWVLNPSSPSYVMLQRVYFYPSESHNGYLDVVNDLGAVGGICLLGYLLTFLRQGLRVLKFARVQASLYLALLFQQLVLNLSESRFFSVLTIEFVIMTLATFSLGRLLLQRRQELKAARQITPIPVPR